MHPGAGGGGGYPHSQPYMGPTSTPPQQQQFAQHPQMMGGGPQPGGGNPSPYHPPSSFAPGPTTAQQQQMMMSQAPTMAGAGAGGMTIKSSTPQQPPFQLQVQNPGQPPINIVNQPQQMQQHTTAYAQHMVGAPNYTVAGPPQQSGGLISASQPQQQQPPTMISQQQQQQPQQPPQTAPQQQFVFDPVAKARGLIQKDLRNTLIGLMRTANELMKLKAQAALDEQADSTSTSTSSGEENKSSDTAEKQEQKQRRARKLTQHSLQVRRCLDQFYAVCDQLEYQFLLIQESQRQSKVCDKNIPIRLKSEENPQGSLNFSHYKKIAEDQIRHAASVQDALQTCINQLSEIRSKDSETSDGSAEAKKMKLESDENCAL